MLKITEKETERTTDKAGGSSQNEQIQDWDRSRRTMTTLNTHITDLCGGNFNGNQI